MDKEVRDTYTFTTLESMQSKFEGIVLYKIFLIKIKNLKILNQFHNIVDTTKPEIIGARR